MRCSAVVLGAAVLGLGWVLVSAPQPTVAQEPDAPLTPAGTDVSVSPEGYFRWACWWRVVHTKIPVRSLSVVSTIDGLAGECTDVSPPIEDYRVWVAVPLDKLQQDMSEGYRLLAHSETGCEGLMSAPSEDACNPTPEVDGNLALVAGAAMLKLLHACRYDSSRTRN